jgi:hypothetical protein
MGRATCPNVPPTPGSLAVVPLLSWPQAFVKLIAAAFRHPNRDKEIVVRRDGRVDVVDLPARERPAAQAS